MNLTQLRYFIATAETLNYTKAANQLYVSRQALRQALQLLEEEFETPLFMNQRNKLLLTAAGEYLKIAGAEALEKFDNITERMKLFAVQKESLTVALSKSLFPFMIPDMDKIIRNFQAAYPVLCLELLPMTNDEAIGAVTEGGCGLIIQMPCQRPGLSMDVLTRYDVIVSGDHLAQPNQPVKPEDLKDRSCIGMGSLYETMRPFYEACVKNNIKLQYEIVPDTIDAFYRVSHENVLAFDILKEDTPFFEKGSHSVLEGYCWEIGFLYREGGRQQEACQIFRRFVKNHI